MADAKKRASREIFKGGGIRRWSSISFLTQHTEKYLGATARDPSGDLNTASIRAQSKKQSNPKGLGSTWNTQIHACEIQNCHRAFSLNRVYDERYPNSSPIPCALDRCSPPLHSKGGLWSPRSDCANACHYFQTPDRVGNFRTCVNIGQNPSNEKKNINAYAAVPKTTAHTLSHCNARHSSEVLIRVSIARGSVPTLILVTPPLPSFTSKVTHRITHSKPPRVDIHAVPQWSVVV
jgi:hypothetical protein